jgi:hypothetical protein
MNLLKQLTQLHRWLTDWTAAIFVPDIPLRPYRVYPRGSAPRLRRRLLRGILLALKE